MKNKWTIIVLLVAFRFSGSAQGYKDIVIVSDFDDTYKITNTTSKGGMVKNVLFSDDVFEGMSSLYKKMNSDCKAFYFLSSSPRALQKKITNLLTENGLGNANLVLAELGEDRQEYKYNNIIEVIKFYPQSKVILIGDDSQHDPEVYMKVAKDYPDVVLDVYIRPVRGRVLTPECKVYYSAYDIALYEVKAGRLDEQFALQLGEQIMASGFAERLLPSYLYFPSDWKPVLNPADKATELQNKLMEKLQNIKKEWGK